MCPLVFDISTWRYIYKRYLAEMSLDMFVEVGIAGNWLHDVLEKQIVLPEMR